MTNTRKPIDRVTWQSLLAALCLCVLASGCTGQLTRWQHESYTVRSGDTLYAIAWHFGVDQRDLARWNGLGSGDVIYPGQQLRLTGPRTAPAAASAGRKETTAARNNSKRGSRSTPSQPRGQLPPPKWQWPVQGKVIAGFGNPKSVGKGIDISGSRGMPVLAAASGRVVYAGSGLLGYGKLIIIKHNETYLSAYGHNEALLAGQGDDVKGGERIAQMGLGPRRVAMLHFEIRVNGDAVDPTRFLPKRPISAN